MAKKRGPGRPKAAANKAKSELMQTRISKDEQRAFSNAAELDGKTVSEWVRDRLRRAARDELSDAGKPVPFLT